MKKIISANSSLMQIGGLRAEIKRLVLEHHPDVAELDSEGRDRAQAVDLLVA